MSIDLNHWFQVFNSELKDGLSAHKGDDFSDGTWTEFVRDLIHDNIKPIFFTGDKIQCICKSHSRKNEKERWNPREYLGIDMTWLEEENPFCISELVIELENDNDIEEYLPYCAWKLLNVKAPYKILICYLDDEKTQKFLKMLKDLPLQDEEQFLLVIGSKFKGKIQGYLKKGKQSFQLLTNSA